MNETIRVMKQHRSFRKYLNQEVPDEIVRELVDVARAAPNSVHGQQTGVIVVRDQTRRDEITEITGQDWIAKAPVFFCFIADFYKLDKAAELHNRQTMITNSVESLIVASIDIGIGIQNVITAAESLGLGTVPIGGIRVDPESIIEVLQLPEHTFPLNGLVIGYPDGEPEQKPRMPVEAYMHDESYHASNIPEVIETYDRIMDEYYERTGQQNKGSWSDRVSRTYSKLYFPHIREELKKQGFFLEG